MEEAVLTDSLERLVQLQQVDAQLMELESAKGDLPREVAEFQARLEELKAWLESKETFRKKSQADRRAQEGLVKLTTEKMKRHQGQLYDVTTNREYDAITAEIEQERQTIGDAETQILELIEAEETSGKEMAERDGEVDGLQGELTTKQKELARVSNSNRERELTLQHEREKIVVRLNKAHMRLYDRIWRAKNGRAVVPVQREACGGCFNAIPPQRCVEIRKMSSLITCETCGRILVWTDNGQHA